MQLPLGTDPRTEQLERIHAALIAEFGRIERPDNKRRDPVWTLVQGVIGARTKTAVSNAATDAMLARFGSWEAVAEAPLKELTAILLNQTFPEQSARRLKDCLKQIIAERGQVDLRHLSKLETVEIMDWLETLPGGVEGFAAKQPMGRIGTPEDIAPLVRFLAGPGSVYLTGQVIAVDGGMSC